MVRPDLRPMRALPVLEHRRSELERCVYCPKLCRSACPVSNAEPKETLIPWGKMSMVSFVAHGDVPLDASHASPAWACTGCYACREACDHRNDVAGTLVEARAALTAAGAGHAAAASATARFDAHEERTRAAMQSHRARAGSAADPSADHALLVGCGYARHAGAEAVDAIAAGAALAGGRVAVADGCCGLPLHLAGDAPRFRAHAERFAASVDRAAALLVADAGCAMALRTHYPAAGVAIRPKVELLVERAARDLAALETVGAGEGARYHDPCQLGRGLGVYEAPRAVLTRALGRAPAEFDARREHAACSGAGGLVPVTMPGVARTIAGTRADEHRRAGGGKVITACASSLRAFRREGLDADDIVSWIARALRARTA